MKYSKNFLLYLIFEILSQYSNIFNLEIILLILSTSHLSVIKLFAIISIELILVEFNNCEAKFIVIFPYGQGNKSLNENIAFLLLNSVGALNILIATVVITLWTIRYKWNLKTYDKTICRIALFRNKYLQIIRLDQHFVSYKNTPLKDSDSSIYVQSIGKITIIQVWIEQKCIQTDFCVSTLNLSTTVKCLIVKTSLDNWVWISYKNISMPLFFTYCGFNFNDKLC